MLSVCRLFYIRYPQICETLSHKLEMIDRSKYSINTVSIRNVEKKRADEICDSPNHKFITPPEVLLTSSKPLVKGARVT